MQYSEGKIGRIWILRFDDGEELPQTIEEFANIRKIQCAIVFIIGGAKSGKLVVGPEKTDTPLPEKVLKTPFFSGREILGIGTIFKNENGKASLHMHIAAGR